MVISLRSAAGIATIWVVAVGGVSATAWIAIDRAGRDITNASVNSLAPLSTPAVLEPTVAEQTPTATETPAPSVSAPPPAPPPTAPTPSTTPSSQAPRRSPTATTPPAPTPPAPTPQVRTASVSGGQITVRCLGSRIQLQVAQPENEWRVHVEDSEPGRVVVSFTQSDDEESHLTRVTATCNQGIPDFTIKTG